MAIILQVSRHGWKTRLLIGAMYALLLAGSVTMIYPFWLMLSGSVSSEYDFNDFRLIPKKTVYDNLDFVMRAVGAPNKEIRQRIPYVLDLVGLKKKADYYPTELSGGEQQRVAIARALVNNPDTIIADEPTGNLDPERSLELMDLLVRINALGTTVVVVTHEKELVNRFGKRVVTLEKGRVIRDQVGGYVGGRIHE